MGLFGNLLGGGGSNPSDAANPFINQIPGTIKPYMEPYINRGNSAYDVMNPQLTSMAQDPAAYLEQLMGRYQPSKSYNLRRDEALQAAGNTAAAGGMRGSLQDITNSSRITDSLLGDDMQQWLNNVLGIQGTGLKGQQDLYNTGFSASQGLSSDLSNVLGTQGQLAFQGAANQNKRQSDMFSGIGTLLGTGVGAFFGGPFGAMVGGSIGGSVF
jgi:hypothetical protein